MSKKKQAHVKSEADEWTAEERAATEAKFAQLINQSAMNSRILAENIKRQKEEAARAEALMKQAADAAPKRGRRAGNAVTQGKRKAADSGGLKKKVGDMDVDEDDDGKGFKIIAGIPIITKQPPLITGATLKDYQLDGVRWLGNLAFNGFSGILADEMGLGKTLQTIGMIAHLREMEAYGPFLIVGPLSVLDNWEAEFKRFAPSIPVVKYHTTAIEGKVDSRITTVKKERAKLIDFEKSRLQPIPKSFLDGEEIPTLPDAAVVITTYDMIDYDKAVLSKYAWDWIIVDEGHRLKNPNSKLSNLLKYEYVSHHRLLITGTPLQNNLSELYSLLSFLDPANFPKGDLFQNLLTFGDDKKTEGMSKMDKTVHKLHEILEPRMLRRLKAQIDLSLPPKKEYILTAPLTAQQKKLADVILSGDLKEFLIKEKLTQAGVETIDLTADSDDEDRPIASSSTSSPSRKRRGTTSEDNTPSKRTRGRRVDYTQKSDEDFFEHAANASSNQVAKSQKELEEIGRQHAMKTAKSAVHQQALQNSCAQLRKVANHPFLFNWPIDPHTNMEIVDERLLAASGKMLLLERLLLALFERGHKVLLFSQFQRTLDIVQAWTDSKDWGTFRLDGSVSTMERNRQMREFNSDDTPDAVRLFLLTTRAGGVGINLQGADTVIFFDSDWNPQVDLQAISRAHRIGQTKPVLIFRLVTANSIESKILELASSKRKLETLVIGTGEFKGKYEAAERDKKRDRNLMVLAEELSKAAEKIHLAQVGDTIISDEQLNLLLDRSPETMQDKKTKSHGAHTSFKAVDSDAQKDVMGELFHQVVPDSERESMEREEARLQDGEDIEEEDV